MGKINPRQVNLREISSVERPKQLAINKFNSGDEYDLSKAKPEIGTPLEQNIRASNMSINVFNDKNEYTAPDDLVL